MTTPFHRLRFVIKATRDIRVPGQQGAMLYALLAKANQHPDTPAAYPRDLLLDAPERTRTTVKQHGEFAFGGTLLAGDGDEAGYVLGTLAAGLRRLGREGKSRREGLGGNFRLERVEDLIAGQLWDGGPLATLPVTHIDAEIVGLADHGELTVRFDSPLRLERPGRLKRGGHSFFDRGMFPASYFVRRLMRRMQAIGVEARDNGADRRIGEDAVQLVENRTVWIDMGYQGRKGKTLGGIVGRVRLATDDPLVRAALVWGQYTRVGKNTAFGFGRYRIEQLGPQPFGCERAVPLLEEAWNHPLRDHLAMKAGLESGALSHTFQQVRDGCYVPHQHGRVTIGEGEKRRELQIPSRRDRALQRLVLEAIGPGIDQLFESSSFAWRRGLGRHSSAKAVAKAYRSGYRYAVNADFDRFFETIPHDLLFDRVSAYVADAPTAALMQQWVCGAMRGRNCGIPTGAPLSPLLGNLMLDRFDERIAQRGGRLIRYGDDFLIFCRDEVQARQMVEAAWDEAKQLELTLNETQPATLDLDEPFTFLGFRFEKTDRWHVRGTPHPRRIEELGWFDASQKPAAQPRVVQLPGETGESATNLGLTAIVGPSAANLEVDADVIVCHYRGGRASTRIPLADLETLVVLGHLGLSSATVGRLTDLEVNVILADERGNSTGLISGDHDLPAEVVMAQVAARRDDQRCLTVAKALVGAKLHNYARLAEAVCSESPTAQRIADRGRQAAAAESIGQLLGIEGAGAAAWYDAYGGCLGRGFQFERRVAPNAEDPVNALLNIGYTHLYRLSILALRAAGLVPSIGLLHEPTGRFQALATDVQEPFRFLIDRLVIEATYRLRPKDFHRDPQGPYALAIAPAAARRFQLMLWRSLQLAHAAGDDADRVSYRVLIQRQARQLRRHLTDPSQPFAPFCLP